MNTLTDIDWSTIPAPENDGAAAHLAGAAMPPVSLAMTSGGSVDLSALKGLSVVYAYPMTGRPDLTLPDGWDMIPGARGCTPQSCAFRDHFTDLQDAGADHLFGLSTQKTDWQVEAKERLHLPFPLLSDADFALTEALNLPSLEAAGQRLLRRFTLIIRDGQIEKVFYPVFPPDRSAQDVLDWLTGDT